ncbi:MAG: hypothetical protein C0480_02935 [Bradyrhizobium sp.]|nr:hypothetical protein [Bradyrhizobium sp.]
MLTWVPVLIWAYFLPCIIALNRGHQAAPPIFIVNLFLGWSLLGWVGALVWAAMPIPEALTLSPLAADCFQRNEPRLGASRT